MAFYLSREANLSSQKQNLGYGKNSGTPENSMQTQKSVPLFIVTKTKSNIQEEFVFCKLIFYWSIPRINFVFVIHLNLAKPITKMLKSCLT
jgi:hypothetical protein